MISTGPFFIPDIVMTIPEVRNLVIALLDSGAITHIRNKEGLGIDVYISINEESQVLVSVN